LVTPTVAVTIGQKWHRSANAGASWQFDGGGGLRVGDRAAAARPSNSALTMAFDDHDGKRSALVREGLKKVLHRRGVLWAGVWVRECKAQTNVTHDHLLFHLPPSLCTGAGLQQLEVSILRLVGLHGGGVTHQNAVKLTFYLKRYLLKGGGREVWERYRLPSSWRRMQGRIYGKPCGVTQSLGPAARLRSLMSKGQPIRLLSPACRGKKVADAPLPLTRRDGSNKRR